MGAKIDVSAVMTRKGSGYPEPFKRKAADRIKQALGDAGGLTQFGVNLVRLPAGQWSSQRHWHAEQDEFVYLLEGEVVLITESGEEVLRAGDCAAFPRGVADAHHMINRGFRDAVYLEVGTRTRQEVAEYPDIDMRLVNGRYEHKDGAPY